MTTFKILKRFQICVLYASDVQPAVRGCDMTSEAETKEEAIRKNKIL